MTEFVQSAISAPLLGGIAVVVLGLIGYLTCDTSRGLRSRRRERRHRQQQRREFWGYE